MESVAKRACARGERCTQFARLGVPAPVSGGSRELCNSCEDKHYGACASPKSPKWLVKTTQAIEEVLPAKASLWDLLELDPHNGGYGWKSDRGKVLSSLDPKTLREVGNWLDEHATEALDRDEHGRYAEFRCTVGTFAWLGTLPPHDPLFPEQSEEALSFQVEGFYKSSGRRKDVTKVVRLAHLREVHRYYSERDLANALDIPRSTVGDMIRRMEEIGFSLEEFSSVDLEYIAFGAQRGRKGNTGSF